MTIVLADGTIVKTRRRPRKSSAGYDLTRLIVGSEGTLGLVTEAVLKVTSVPENLHVVVATFPNTHFAVKTAVALIGSGLPIDAIELLDKHSMWAINQSHLSPRQWRESPTLFLKLSGLQLAVQAHLEITKQAAQKNHCQDFEVSGNQDEIDISWGARKAVGKSLMAMKKDPTDLFLNADAAVPISSLADMIEETHQKIIDAGLTGSTLGHVGDGRSPSLASFFLDEPNFSAKTSDRQLPHGHRLPPKSKRGWRKSHRLGSEKGGPARRHGHRGTWDRS